MNGRVVKQLTLCTLVCISITLQSGRSPWRPRDPLLPEIKAYWSDDAKPFYLRDHCLEYHAIFCKFNRKHFDARMIPDGSISYRNLQEKTVDSKELKRLAEGVLKEIHTRKKHYTDFTVLKKTDFNVRLASGLIILKYKKYPFVLKLFVKTPQTFCKQAEGVVPKFFFRMGGGTNRHLAGFTRIPNLEKIRERIQENPKYSQLVDTPRKWYWTPEDMRWISIEGKNIGNNGPCKTEIPGTYGIIVDAIDTEKQFSESSEEDKKFGLEFAAYIGNRMDAHVDNLILEKGTGKIVMIDTEHFPTMVGLKEPITFDSYSSWYLQLSSKCFSDNFLRDKKFRREMQTKPRPELYILYQEPVQLAQAHHTISTPPCS